MKNKKAVFWVWLMMTFALSSTISLAATLFVDASRPDDSGDGSSWASAKQTIQAAVDQSADGDTVWVTNGTYDLGGAAVSGQAQTNRVCITLPVTVRSVNGPDFTTILGAAGSNGSNDVDSVRGVCLTTNATLSGFTVSGGYSVNTGNYTYDRPGAGIWLTTGAVVSNCVITGNSSLAGGGGVNIYGGLLTHSMVYGNQSASGGGGVSLGSDGVMSDCVVSNNMDTGWNGGGGAYLSYGGEVNRTVFKGNSAMSGGGVLSERGGPLNNCLFVGNIASDGGGGVAGTEAVINNCTIVGNSVTNDTAWQGGGGVAAVMSGMVELNNCIVWGNISSVNSNLAVASWDTIRNTCVPEGEGITNGVDGCVTSDPLFVNAGAGDYELQTASPCVNAGDNTYAPAGIDFAGNARINNGVVDMGAYEQTAILPQYVITTTAGVNGVMLPTNPLVYQGSDQTITITSDVAYKIDSLSVDGSPITVTNEYTFTNVQSAHTIAATFALDPHALSVISGSGDGSYTNAAIVPVSADSATLGMAFSHWTAIPVEYVSGLASTSSVSTTFVMPQAEVELTANYKGTVAVRNVSAAQRPGTKLVDVFYDVFSGATNAVSVSLSLLDGASNVTASTLSGDVGSGVATGAEKSILWNMGADWNGRVAELTFDVSASAGSLEGADVATQSVDSRNYTLTVNSSPEGGYGKLSKKGYYEVSASYGSVDGTTSPIVKKTSGSSRSEWEFPFYASASEGMPYRFTYSANTSVSGLHPGAQGGYGRVQVDPKTGTIKAGSQAHNRGGPTHWRDSGGDLHQYYSSQSGWGFGTGIGGVRRIYEVTGTAPFYMTLNETFEGEFDTEEDTSGSFRSISFVSRIKDRDEYLNSLEMVWGWMTDLASASNSYDWVFGENQEVAEFLLQTGFENSSGNDTNETRDVSGEHHLSFLVNPGDLIVVDNWMRVAAATKNPFEVLDNFAENRARADHFVLTSELSMEGGSGGGANDYACFDWKTIGNPVPDTGTHSNYCWMSEVICSVDSVEGYVNTGWTGTGSVPNSGSSSTTGAITLSNLNSSISWEWELGGYPLTVNNGTGSGNYTNGNIIAISATDPVGFHHWEGDHIYDLADPLSSSTTIKMPSVAVELTPVYAPMNAYVDASMPDNSLGGSSWSTAKKTIQAAVDIVAENGTVWVTNGVYNLDGAVAQGDVQTNRVCITRPLTVRSMNGADVTTITGEGWYGNVRGVYMRNSCSLIGFTVREGDANDFGGGIFLTESCIVDSCVIVSNWSDQVGGGAYLQGGTLNNCIIKRNAVEAEGGGLYLMGGEANNCLVVNNQANYTGAGVSMNAGKLRNCTVINNEGNGCSGVSINWSGAAIYNCIVLDNFSWGNEGRNDISNEDGGTIWSCLYGIKILTPTQLAMHNSIVVGGVSNSPVIGRFCDPQTFKLYSSSVGIDRGDNAYAPPGNALGGSDRIINGRVDIGAYEHSGVMTDVNANEIPDEWEQYYYEMNTPDMSSLCSNGVNTVREAFIAGFDPKNPEGRFFAQIDPVSGAVRWPLAQGRVYSVYWTPSLTNDFTWKADIPWTDGIFIDADYGSSDAGFYKIDVRIDD